MPNPNSPVYPGSLPSVNNLPVANDTLFAELSGDITSGATSGITLSIGGFNTPTLVVIDSEIILVTALSGSTITACTRGFAGSTPAAHLSGSSVFGYIVSYHHNQIIAEIISICATLGVNLTNVILSGQAAAGDLAGFFPAPTVATVGGFSSGQVATAVTNNHVANTDTGTTSTSFQVDSGNSGPKIKNNSGVLDVKNAADSAYARLKSMNRIVVVNTVSFSATPAFNLALGDGQKITLTADVTSSTVSNLVAGMTITFTIIQDGTAGHAFAWPTNVKGGMVTSGATANQVSTQTFWSPDGTNLYATSTGVTV